LKELALELRPPESRHYASWRERLHAVSRMSRPDEVHALVEEAHALGARAVLAVFDDAIREALTSFQRWRDVAVWAVVPNMFSFIRDLTDLGMVGAAAARFRRLAPRDMLRTGLGAALRLDRVLRRDFATGVMLVAEMELLALRSLRVTRICLHPQLTEIALAGRVAELLTEFASRVHALGMEPGLITHNPLLAEEVLGPALRQFAAVVTPCNSKGYKMVPDRASCEALMRAQPGLFWASETTAGGSIGVAQALDRVRSLGLAGALVDLRMLEAAYREGVKLLPPA
jgi:hypothetical protein